MYFVLFWSLFGLLSHLFFIVFFSANLLFCCCFSCSFGHMKSLLHCAFQIYWNKHWLRWTFFLTLPWLYPTSFGMLCWCLYLLYTILVPLISSCLIFHSAKCCAVSRYLHILHILTCWSLVSLHYVIRRWMVWFLSFFF